jgi:hypothetical protein
MQQLSERTEQGQSYLRVYDDIGEVADHAEQTLRSRHGRGQNASINGDYDFTHTDSLEEALELLRHGWPEGLQAAQDLLSKIDIHAIAEQFPQRFSQEIEHDVAGDEPDVDRYLVNDPESMITVTPSIDRIGSIATILVNASQHARVKASRMRRRGVVVMGLVEALTSLGYSVDLQAYQLITPEDYDKSAMHETRIPLLSPGMPASLDTIAFAVAHPSFLRRIMFALEERESTKIRDRFGIWESEGYGFPRDLDPTSYEGTDTIHIGKDKALCSSDSKMPKQLEKMLHHLFSREAALEDVA